MLRNDGIAYQRYVTELTSVLFLKMASEQKEERRILEAYRWSRLKTASEAEPLTVYNGSVPILVLGRVRRWRRVDARIQ